MKRLKALRARTGTYTDRQTGQEKTSYMTMGYLLEGDKGKMIKIDAVPINFDGWVFFGDIETKRPQQEAQQPRQEAQQQGGLGDFDDQIPFDVYERGEIV